MLFEHYGNNFKLLFVLSFLLMYINMIENGIVIPVLHRKVSSNNTRLSYINQFIIRRNLDYSNNSFYYAYDDFGFSDIPPVYLSNFYNNEYVGSLGVGTPTQYMTVIFDTGSSDVWFPSTKCTSCGKHTLYDSSLSTTYNIKPDGTTTTHTDKTFTISYGSGQVSGIVALETIVLSTLKIPSVLIGEITEEDSAIADFDMDGICGLAFDGLSTVTRPGIMDSLQHSYPNLSHSFSFYLNTDPTDTAKPSSIIFGGYNLSLVSPTAEFFYTPVVRDTKAKTYWTVQLTEFEIANELEFTSIADMTSKYSACSSSGTKCLAIVDTGTSGIGIPTEYYSSVVESISGNMECKELTCINVAITDFPVIFISIAPDNVFPLLASDYVECYKDHKVCIIRLQETSDIWILGDVFIEAYYTHFDAKNMRVGFACDGQCDGGTWHGVGGDDIIFDSSMSVWKRGAFISSLFFLLLFAFMLVMNAATSYCFAAGKQQSKLFSQLSPKKLAYGSSAQFYDQIRYSYIPIEDLESYISDLELEKPLDFINKKKLEKQSLLCRQNENCNTLENMNETADC